MIDQEEAARRDRSQSSSLLFLFLGGGKRISLPVPGTNIRCFFFSLSSVLPKQRYNGLFSSLSCYHPIDLAKPLCMHQKWDARNGSSFVVSFLCRSVWRQRSTIEHTTVCIVVVGHTVRPARPNTISCTTDYVLRQRGISTMFITYGISTFRLYI